MVTCICNLVSAQNAPLNHVKKLSGSLRVVTTTTTNIGGGNSATVIEEKVIIQGNATLAADQTMPVYMSWPFITMLTNTDEVEAAYRQWDANIVFAGSYRKPCVAEGMMGVVDSSHSTGTGRKKARLVIGAVMNYVSISYDCQQEIDVQSVGIGCKKAFTESLKQSIGEKREFQIDMPTSTNFSGTKTFTSIDGDAHISTVVTWDFHAGS